MRCSPGCDLTGSHSSVPLSAVYRVASVRPWEQRHFKLLLCASPWPYAALATLTTFLAAQTRIAAAARTGRGWQLGRSVLFSPAQPPAPSVPVVLPALLHPQDDDVLQSSLDGNLDDMVQRNIQDVLTRVRQLACFDRCVPWLRPACRLFSCRWALLMKSRMTIGTTGR